MRHLNIPMIKAAKDRLLLLSQDLSAFVKPDHKALIREAEMLDPGYGV